MKNFKIRRGHYDLWVGRTGMIGKGFVKRFYPNSVFTLFLLVLSYHTFTKKNILTASYNDYIEEATKNDGTRI